MDILEDDWNYTFDFVSEEKKRYQNFEHFRFNNILGEHLLQLLDAFENKNFSLSPSSHTGPNNKDDQILKVLVEQNKELHHNIDTKLKELSKQEGLYESFKKDKKLLSQEIKERHEAFLMAKKYYKILLKIYYTVECRQNERQKLYLQFFTETKKDSEKYSIRLLRDTKTGHYELLEMNPKLSMFKDLQKRLKETNDVSGALSFIRQAFISVKESKK